MNIRKFSGGYRTQVDTGIHHFPGGYRVDGAGEGSRGGIIMGHTNSGKPIYRNHTNPAHDKFSVGEHHEARDLHHKFGAIQGRIEKGLASEKIRGMAAVDRDHHSSQAALHERSAKRGGVDSPFKSGHRGDAVGERSRGGRVSKKRS